MPQLFSNWGLIWRKKQKKKQKKKDVEMPKNQSANL